MNRFCFSIALWMLLMTVLCQAQSTTNAERPLVEVISYKIGSNYNPMLERQSMFTADNPDFPQNDAERNPRRNIGQQPRTSNTNPQTINRGIIAAEDRSSRGKLRSSIHIIDQAEWVNLTVRNLADKPIKAIVWDFAFSRLENGKLLHRYEVVSPTEIKPGNKKSLKQRLPAEAKRCQIVSAESASAEMVCGKGFTDPTQNKQEPFGIKRIEYADGSFWQKN